MNVGCAKARSTIRELATRKVQRRAHAARKHMGTARSAVKLAQTAKTCLRERAPLPTLPESMQISTLCDRSHIAASRDGAILIRAIADLSAR
jgi:hypothetical protein